ncbi:hypothetical protein GONAM_15_01550 [Gordonia namibiensis NBRC 108229]|uniref:Enoyl-CoA hydratase n=1 Tax=Gordonia namibiensis NBRC 108229 TaxID=1208314 RepID=K6WM24_9ACTN|nr:hypothetical protein GONAM_15_01550 [Gordonia namibiensis NBRC 108229]
MKKLVIAVISAVTAVVMCLSGSGDSSAAPVPELSTTGSDFGTFGDHSFCRGSFRVTLDAPKKTRGLVRVTVHSHGFTGDGPGWKRNPKCRVKLAAIWFSGQAYNAMKYSTATFGPKRGEKHSWDVRTGSGLVSLTVRGYTSNLPVNAPQSVGYGAFILVP